MAVVLPFRLKVAGKDEFDGLNAVSTSFKVHGFMSLDGDALTIEWGGTAQVQSMGVTSMSDDTEALPIEQLVVPVQDLHRAELTGGWFRPRLTLQGRTLFALAGIPSEDAGVVNFWYDRSERFTAIAMVNALTAAMEHARTWEVEGGPGELEESIDTPPGGGDAVR